MHTPWSRPSISHGTAPLQKRSPLRVVFLVAVLVGLLGSVPPVQAQGSFPGSGTTLNTNVRLYPLDVWGPRVGPGIGAGLVVHNLGRRHAQWLLTAAPALHEQVATLSFASAHPGTARQYVIATARALHTDRRWFYGLGPAAPHDARLSFRQRTGRVHIGVGQAVWGRRLHIRPHVTLQHVRTTGRTGDASALPPRSQRHAERLRDTEVPGAQQTGVRAGVRIRYETRSSGERTGSSAQVQGEWDRYVDLSGVPLSFDQLDVKVRGSIPLSSRHRLLLRSSLVRTWSRDTAPVPFYQRPTLDGSIVPGWARSRFVGHDRLTATARYEFPLIDTTPVFALDGHLGVHAAGIYDDLPAQFEPVLSFKETLSPAASTYPLRPSASVGLTVRMPMRPRATVDLALGMSPEGLSAMRLTIDQPLSLIRPPHHTSRSLR